MTFIYILLSLWALWYLYLIVMGLYRARMMGRLSNGALVLGAPAILVGVLLDWLVNLLSSIVFRELPSKPTELLTERLTRYLNGPKCRNQHWAKIICWHLLDPFDSSPDGHCHIKKTS